MLEKTVKIPESGADVEALRIEERQRAEKLSRDAVIKANRDHGKEEPKPGSKMYVSTARGIATRGRAGLMFSQTPAEVTVSDEADDAIAKKVKGGAYVVSVWGAEQILADSYPDTGGLIVFANRRDAGTPNLAGESTEALEAELARRKTAAVRDHEDRIRSKQHPKSKDEEK